MRLLATVFLALLAAPLPAAPNGDSILGLWRTEPTDNGYAHVEISERGGTYDGLVVWLSEPEFPPGDERAGQPKVDRLNPDPAERGRPVLGLPPTWYKSAPYRSRVVRDPRGVLAELGVTLPDGVETRVWDSTAEVRYLVIPQQPKGTDGWSEEQLAELVTRDSMIGVGHPRDPSEVAST